MNIFVCYNGSDNFVIAKHGGLRFKRLFKRKLFKGFTIYCWVVHRQNSVALSCKASLSRGHKNSLLDLHIFIKKQATETLVFYTDGLMSFIHDSNIKMQIGIFESSAQYFSTLISSKYYTKFLWITFLCPLCDRCCAGSCRNTEVLSMESNIIITIFTYRLIGADT